MIKAGILREHYFSTVEKLYFRGLKCNPYLISVYNDLADLYYGLSRMIKSWQCWNLARSLNPAYPDLEHVYELETMLLSPNPTPTSPNVKSIKKLQKITKLKRVFLAFAELYQSPGYPLPRRISPHPVRWQLDYRFLIAPLLDPLPFSIVQERGQFGFISIIYFFKKHFKDNKLKPASNIFPLSKQPKHAHLSWRGERQSSKINYSKYRKG